MLAGQRVVSWVDLKAAWLAGRWAVEWVVSKAATRVFYSADLLVGE